ncbi:hypothetical protein J4427_01845 [Candidatus Woesearchaeota archaeon]|nr:hypothetical protein [Candidatus Woesearchaeota archaeon]
MKKDIIKIIIKSLVIILVIFGLFIIYQIIKKILGGSWSTENIIVSLLILNLGVVLTIGFTAAELRSDHNHLNKQFLALARDFKDHIKK